MHAKWATWVSDRVTHRRLKCGLSLPGILPSLWQTQLFLATKALVSGAGESSAPQDHVFQQSHSVQAATSQVLVPVTGLLVHPLTTGQHLDWICRRKKKAPHVILCVAQISAVTLPSQRKGKEMMAGRVHVSTKRGLNHQDWSSIAVISPPQTLQGPTGGTPQPPGLPTPLHNPHILGMLHPMLGWAHPALGLEMSRAQRQLVTPSTAGFGLSLRGQK